MNQSQFTDDLLNLKSKLYFYAISLTAASDKADDLLQDTLLKALTSRDKFREDTNLKAWLYTIMKNTFINDYRRNVKTRNLFEESDNDLLLNFYNDKVYPSPDSFYNSREIQQTINNLKDEFRIPFNLFLEGYMYKEISERLALPIGTVKSRIFFSRKKLEILLSEYACA